jgi:oligosaccharyltransferase complex subunit delta (ribophorin II)
MNFSKLSFFLLLSVILVASQTLDATLKTKSVGKSPNDLVKVQVTDNTGKVITGSKVTVTKAYPTGNSKSILVQNVDLTASGEEYSFNLLQSKPDIGSYTLELAVTPSDKKYREFKKIVQATVLGQIVVSDVQVTVSDSDDSLDVAKGTKHKAEVGKTIVHRVKVAPLNHLWVDFKVKSAAGKDLAPQQAFIIITDQNGRELIRPAKYANHGFTAHVSAIEIGNEFYGVSGDYQLTLVIADSWVANPTSWNVAKIAFEFAESTKAPIPENPFQAKPTIEHKFRQPEKRPPQTISFAFTVATVGIPFLVLFIGLGIVGANLKNFPGGANFVFAVGFQASLASFLVLFGLYWLRLNMVQTLGYLALLSIPGLYFAHKNLNALSAKSHAQ